MIQKPSWLERVGLGGNFLVLSVTRRLTRLTLDNSTSQSEDWSLIISFYQTNNIAGLCVRLHTSLHLTPLPFYGISLHDRVSRGVFATPCIILCLVLQGAVCLQVFSGGSWPHTWTYTCIGSRGPAHWQGGVQGCLGGLCHPGSPLLDPRLHRQQGPCILAGGCVGVPRGSVPPWLSTTGPTPAWQGCPLFFYLNGHSPLAGDGVCHGGCCRAVLLHGMTYACFSVMHCHVVHSTSQQPVLEWCALTSLRPCA